MTDIKKWQTLAEASKQNPQYEYHTLRYYLIHRKEKDLEDCFLQVGRP